MNNYKFLKVAEFDAVGGPSKKGKDESGNAMGPTDKGRYVVYQIGKHVSPTYPFSSGIKWGTPLKIAGGKAQVKINGVWKDLTSHSAYFNQFKSKEGEKAILQFIQDQYAVYKNAARAYDKNSVSKTELYEKYPGSWIFNDFGHLTIKYFSDRNGNFKWERGESKSLEYIHTTPIDEYFHSKDMPRSLSQSHGCTHVKPKDIESFIIMGYAKIGSVIEVKQYSEDFAPISFESDTGRPDYEIHFYPGLRKVFVYSVSVIVR